MNAIRVAALTALGCLLYPVHAGPAVILGTRSNSKLGPVGGTSPTGAVSNRLVTWLGKMDALRKTLGMAA